MASFLVFFIVYIYILGMKFLWLCRNASESFPKIVTDVINGVVDTWSEDFARFRINADQGCYRDGQYLLSNATFFELRTSQMMQNETYVIMLVVRKGERTRSTTQTLELGPDNLPSLAIR